MELSARQFGRIEAACAALTKLTEKNEVGTVLVNTIREQEILRQGAGLIPAIRMICQHFGLTQKEFAEIIGVSETSLSASMNGEVRDILLRRMTEFFGDGKED